MVPRSSQQLGGAIIALIASWLSIWIWHKPVTSHPFYLKGAVLFPAFAVVGLALILFPGYREERIAQGEDISKLHGWRLITLRWWAVLAVGILVGIGHLILLLSRFQ